MAVYWKLLLFSLFHCLLGFSALYHFASLNLLEPYVRNLINDTNVREHSVAASETEITWRWSIITSFTMVGYAAGSLLIEPLAEKFGRRPTVGVFKNLIVIAGSLLQYFAVDVDSWLFLLFGNFVASCAFGFSDYACVYVAECAPSHNRGFVSALTALGYRLWIMIGLVMGLPEILGDQEYWQYVLLVPIVPAIMQILLTPLHPESPKHLSITEQREVAARKAILFFHGPTANVDAVLAEYAAERALQTTADKWTWKQIIHTKHLLWPLLLCVVAMTSASVAGTDVVDQYSTEILVSAGFSVGYSDLYGVLFVQLPSLVCTMASVLMLSFWGRKKLLLIGFGVGIAGAILVSFSGFFFQSDVLVVAGMALIVTGDSFGPLVIRLFLPGELCPQQIRSLTVSASIVIDNSISALIVFLWPTLFDKFQFRTMVILLAMSVPSFIFLWLYLPETKDRTVNEALQRWIEEPAEIIPLLPAGNYSPVPLEKPDLKCRLDKARRTM